MKKKKNSAGYVDGFVLAVPKKKLALYKKMAREGRDMWMKHGAIDYYECVADDMRAPWSLPFPKMMRLKPSEVAVFSFITYKTRKHRDAVNAKVMKGMEKSRDKYKDMEMPFDMKRMAYGGFKVLVKN